MATLVINSTSDARMRDLLGLPLLLLSTVAFGKCATTPYSLSGVVLDGVGKPLPHAGLVVQWQDHGKRLQQLESIADADGAYTLTIPFYPYSGRSLWGPDRCAAILHSVTIRIGTTRQVVDLSGQATHADLVVVSP